MTKQTSFLDELDPVPQWQGGPASPVEPQPKSVKTGEQLKEQGIARAAKSSAAALGHMREIAHDCATGRCYKFDGTLSADGLACSDDVWRQWQRENEDRMAADLEPIPYPETVAGAVFRNSPLWVATNIPYKSQRPQSHANPLTVWRLKHGG